MTEGISSDELRPNDEKRASEATERPHFVDFSSCSVPPCTDADIAMSLRVWPHTTGHKQLIDRGSDREISDACQGADIAATQHSTIGKFSLDATGLGFAGKPRQRCRDTEPRSCRQFHRNLSSTQCADAISLELVFAGDSAAADRNSRPIQVGDEFLAGKPRIAPDASFGKFASPIDDELAS